MAKYSISLKEVEFIASAAQCPKCGSKNVRFDLPRQSHIETKDGKLSKVVLDFTKPNWWLKESVTHCLDCGVAFHIRDNMDTGAFYKGLLDVQQSHADEEAPVKWAYKFYDFEKLE